MTEYSIKTSRVFNISLQRLLAFLTINYSDTKARKTVSSIKIKTQEQLTLNPLAAPISERMLALGFSNYRELIIDEHNIIFYQLDDERKLIIAELVMDAGQSIRKLLHEVNLLY